MADYTHLCIQIYYEAWGLPKVLSLSWARWSAEEAACQKA